MSAPHQARAMKLLIGGFPLKRNEGQFLGGLAYDANPLTEKQANWLNILLERHGLLSLDGGDHD